MVRTQKYDGEKYRRLWAAKVSECQSQRMRLRKTQSALRAAVEFFESNAVSDLNARSAMLTALRALVEPRR